MSEPFKVGDRVAVFDGDPIPRRCSTVAKRAKQYVLLDDGGSKWALDGTRWASSTCRNCSRERIAHVTPTEEREHMEAATHRRLAADLPSTSWMDWERLTLKQLQTIKSMLTAAGAR